jgi:cell division septation protein DedD
MTYEISLTKARGIALGAAVCCLSVLLFTSGVLVGIGLWKPSREEIAMAKEYRQREAAARHVVSTLPAKADASLTVPASVPAAVPLEAAAPVAHDSVPPAISAPAPAVAAVQEAEAAPDATELSAFVLQVGSFRDVKNAQQLQSDLKAKGYPATVFNALDSDQRMWHVVRIGRYQDLASAADDAAKIGDKEQLQALIKRGGRL